MGVPSQEEKEKDVGIKKICTKMHGHVLLTSRKSLFLDHKRYTVLPVAHADSMLPFDSSQTFLSDVPSPGALK